MRVFIPFFFSQTAVSTLGTFFSLSSRVQCGVTTIFPSKFKDTTPASGNTTRGTFLAVERKLPREAKHLQLSNKYKRILQNQPLAKVAKHPSLQPNLNAYRAIEGAQKQKCIIWPSQATSPTNYSAHVQRLSDSI